MAFGAHAQAPRVDTINNDIFYNPYDTLGVRSAFGFIRFARNRQLTAADAQRFLLLLLQMVISAL